MVNRISDLNPNIPLTILNGSESWLAKLFDFNSLYSIRENGYLDVQTIENAGHHIFADQSDEFNQVVNQICNLTEENYKIWGLHSSSDSMFGSNSVSVNDFQLITNL